MSSLDISLLNSFRPKKPRKTIGLIEQSRQFKMSTPPKPETPQSCPLLLLPFDLKLDIIALLQAESTPSLIMLRLTCRALHGAISNPTRSNSTWPKTHMYFYYLENEHPGLLGLGTERFPCYSCHKLRNAVHFRDSQKQSQRVLGGFMGYRRECEGCYTMRSVESCL